MTEPTVRCQRQHRITQISIHRPEVKNAVDDATMNAIREEVLKSYIDGTRVVILSGSHGAFSSGADIKKALASNLNPKEAISILTDSYGPAIRAVRNCPCPVIAAIDGVAAGIGLDLALACDIRLASETAQLSELFIRVGLVPDGGGTYHLQRLVGVAKAMELTYTGDSVPAQEALRLGMVNQVYPSASFEADVMAFAKKIAMQSPTAIRKAKAAILMAQTGTLEEAMDREAQAQLEIFESEDGFEGFRAFLEKRPPKWMSE